MIYGATPEEWDHFVSLGLTADLLPVLSNITATISPNSKMKDLGKVPSGYNAQREAVGIAGWTSRVSNPADISRWKKESDYGIAQQTRYLRACDNDLTDPDFAREVEATIDTLVPGMPTRRRENSPKCLKVFFLEGEHPKRVIRTAHGIIEFLGNGQQFIAVGTHPSGVRYQWDNDLPRDIPVLTEAQFNLLWSTLQDKYGIEPDKKAKVSSKSRVLAEIHDADPTARYLIENDWVKDSERDGRLHIRCPFEEHHTTDTGDSSTTYWPAHTGGYALGHFKCLHAHCEERSDEEFKLAIGISEDDFDDLTLDVDGESTTPYELTTTRVDMYDLIGDPSPTAPADAIWYPKLPLDMVWRPMHVTEFLDRPLPTWIVKDILPEAVLAVIFGGSGEGKSFAALDMALAIVRGEEWHGHKTKRMRVAYVAAEGASGVTMRIKAYCYQHKIDPRTLDLFVIDGAPNLLDKAVTLAVAKAILALGGIKLVFVDTLAQVTPGGNENSGEDMGKALAHCKGIHKATSAMVVLIHHSGKDTSRGARGWSGLRAACDAEMEVVSNGEDRTLTTTKQKDGEAGVVVGFRLQKAPVGVDADGNVVESCFVVPVKGARRIEAAPRKKLGPAQERSVSVCEMMYNDNAEWPTEYELTEELERLIKEEGGSPKRGNIRLALQRTLENGGLCRVENNRIAASKAIG